MGAGTQMSPLRTNRPMRHPISFAFSLGYVFKEIDVTEECIKMRKLVTYHRFSSPEIVLIQDSLSQNGHDF